MAYRPPYYLSVYGLRLRSPTDCAGLSRGHFDKQEKCARGHVITAGACVCCDLQPFLDHGSSEEKKLRQVRLGMAAESSSSRGSCNNHGAYSGCPYCGTGIPLTPMSI